jgi:hypothetical protein
VSFSLVIIFRSCEDWLLCELPPLGPNFRHSSTGLRISFGSGLLADDHRAGHRSNRGPARTLGVVQCFVLYYGQLGHKVS